MPRNKKIGAYVNMEIKGGGVPVARHDAEVERQLTGDHRRWPGGLEIARTTSVGFPCPIPSCPRRLASC